MIDHTFDMQLDDLDRRASVLCDPIRERTRWSSQEYVCVLAVRLACKCHSRDRHDLGQKICEALVGAMSV
ncbi:MAG: hypothetical protein ACYDG4_15150 [Desulfuromonadaceae bacterium]